MSNDHSDHSQDKSQDHAQDSSQGDSAAHAEASIVPESTDMISFGHKPEKTADASNIIAPSSKDIVLQRLTPHSSWESMNHAAPENDASESTSEAFTAKPENSVRRSLPMAAVVAIAAIVGAAAGSAATFSASHMVSGSTDIAAQTRSIESAVAKLNADIASLKSASTSQSAKIAERIDRVEKAQAEPAAKLAKLSETVEKLRAPETTGAIAAPASAQPGRLPVVEGWSLREVADGMATVIGRDGMYDVLPGDPLPGVGRVDAIRRQDGRWVVVTSRGLIVSR